MKGFVFTLSHWRYWKPIFDYLHMKPSLLKKILSDQCQQEVLSIGRQINDYVQSFDLEKAFRLCFCMVEQGIYSDTDHIHFHNRMIVFQLENVEDVTLINLFKNLLNHIPESEQTTMYIPASTDSLHHAAKKKRKELLKDLSNPYKQPLIVPLVEARIFAKECGRDCIYSKQENHIYYWKEDVALWVAYSLEEFNETITAPWFYERSQSFSIEDQKQLNQLGFLYSVTKLFRRNIPQLSFRMNHINPHLFPLKGGMVLDLKTKEVRERRRDDFFSYESTVGKPSQHSQDLDRIDQWARDVWTNESIRKFVANVALYCLLSGNPKEWYIGLYGEGSNGKTMFTNLLSNILTPNACYWAKNQVAYGKNYDESISSHNEGLIQFKDKRVIIIGDGEKKNGSLNLNQLKQLTTSAGKISLRGINQEEQSIDVTWKIIIQTNNRPEYEDVSHADDRRAIWIPFQTCFVDQVELPHQKQKDPAVASWLATPQAVQAFFDWILINAEDRFLVSYVAPPEEIRSFKSQLHTINPIAEWIQEQMVVNNNPTDNSQYTLTSVLFNQYKEWYRSTRAEEPKISLKSFSVWVQSSFHLQVKKLKYGNVLPIHPKQ